MGRPSLEATILFLESTTGGEVAMDVVSFLKELKRAREECEKPILIRCACGGVYKRGEEDTMGRLKPFSQADVNIRWRCSNCGRTVSTGPSWGIP
jgi:hypothetical protein